MLRKMGKKESELVAAKILRVEAENRRKGLLPETDEEVCRRYGFTLGKKKRKSAVSLKRADAMLSESDFSQKDAIRLGRKINRSIWKKHEEKDQRGILKLAGACAGEANDLEQWKKEIRRNRKKQKLREFS